MKKIFFLLGFTLFIGAAFAQKAPEFIEPEMPVDKDSKLITYSAVVEVSGMGKAELYDRLLAWFNTFYKNPGDVIRERDVTNGRITGKARFKISNAPDKTGLKTDAGLVMYTITATVKDGRFKYVITDLNWKQPSYYPIERWMDKTSKMYSKSFDYYLFETDEYVTETIKKLEDAMKTAPKKKADEW